ncbi:MAG: hypothetical protein ACRYE8_00575 [Janthinobacterium lividum]
MAALPAWIISHCHPVIYSRDPVKNTNKISIFYYFLDTVDKPRYMTTLGRFSIHAGNASRDLFT